MNINETLKNYIEYKNMINELKTMLQEAETELIKYMGNDPEKIVNGYKLSHIFYEQKRFNSNEFKQYYPDLYERFKKPVQCEKFSVKI